MYPEKIGLGFVLFAVAAGIGGYYLSVGVSGYDPGAASSVSGLPKGEGDRREGEGLRNDRESDILPTELRGSDSVGIAARNMEESSLILTRNRESGFISTALTTGRRGDEEDRGGGKGFPENIGQALAEGKLRVVPAGISPIGGKLRPVAPAVKFKGKVPRQARRGDSSTRLRTGKAKGR